MVSARNDVNMLSEFEERYLREKPGQPRCADCGSVYLWRSYVKRWELLVTYRNATTRNVTYRTLDDHVTERNVTVPNRNVT